MQTSTFDVECTDRNGFSQLSVVNAPSAQEAAEWARDTFDTQEGSPVWVQDQDTGDAHWL